jgi:hypothetical protein
MTDPFICSRCNHEGHIAGKCIEYIELKDSKLLTLCECDLDSPTET